MEGFYDLATPPGGAACSESPYIAPQARELLEIGKQVGPACATLSPMEEDDLHAWLAALVKEDLSTAKNIQKELSQGDAKPQLLLAELPPDTRPPASGGGEGRFANQKSHRRHLMTREDQVAYLFKDFFSKHKGEVVAVSAEWTCFTGRIPTKLLSSQFIVPWPSCVPASGGAALNADRVPIFTPGVGAGPNLSQRFSSLVAPDLTQKGSFWVRRAHVTTWVRLASALGNRFTAAALYQFYLSCELLTTKKIAKTGAHCRMKSVAKWKGTKASSRPSR